MEERDRSNHHARRAVRIFLGALVATMVVLGACGEANNTTSSPRTTINAGILQPCQGSQIGLSRFDLSNQNGCFPVISASCFYTSGTGGSVLLENFTIEPKQGIKDVLTVSIADPAGGGHFVIETGGRTDVSLAAGMGAGTGERPTAILGGQSGSIDLTVSGTLAKGTVPHGAATTDFTADLASSTTKGHVQGKSLGC